MRLEWLVLVLKKYKLLIITKKFNLLRFLTVLLFCLSVTVLLQAQESSTSGNTADDEYLLLREQLIAQDRSTVFDRNIVLDSAEEVLDKRLVALRDSMLMKYKEQHFFPPARYFFQSKKHIEETGLFRIISMMPKGGILHLHDAAAGDARWVVNRVLSEPGAYVYWDAENGPYTKGQINFYRQHQAPPGFYEATLLNRQVENFPDSLHALLTFDESIDADSVDIWNEFELVFQRIYGFVRYQPVFKDYVRHYLELLVADGIQHVELRSIISGLYHLQHPEGYFNADSTIGYLQESAKTIRQKEPAFTLKIIYTSLRFKSPDQILQDLATAYELRRRFPGLIKGFDLVAEEDHGHSTLFFLETWMKMDSLEQVYGVDMPLYLHDGESDWVSSRNLYDAVLLNSRRIGHGFNLFRYPNLLEQVRSRDICLEINPISNQILGFIRDLRLHPGSNYLTRGVPCVISSDDPLIFDYRGLSYDFWEVFLAWELDLRKLKGLALNSLIYSALDEQEKEDAVNYFNERWSRFVESALNELNQ